MKQLLIGFLATTIALASSPVASAVDTKEDRDPENINLLLMHATFKIHDPASINPLLNISADYCGTSFLVCRPLGMLGGKTMQQILLVTARHVLDGMTSEVVTLDMRRRDKGGVLSKFEVPVRIRNDKGPLYTCHNSADVAVISLLENIGKTERPQVIELMNDVSDIRALPLSAVADDDVLEKEDLPGDELMALGYPFGAGANDEGFPILRGGYLASYPVVPSRVRGQFLFDFTVHKGNSGGPVYSRKKFMTLKSGALTERTVQHLVGLVSNKNYLSGLDVRMGGIVPSTQIKDTIDLVPVTIVPK